MCKEALFINLNHFACSFSQSVVQKFLKVSKKWLFRIEKIYADSLLT